MRFEDAKTRELALKMSALRSAECYLDLTLFTDADYEKCQALSEAQDTGADDKDGDSTD